MSKELTIWMPGLLAIDGSRCYRSGDRMLREDWTDRIAEAKRFTDAELAAEWHNACFEFQHTRDYQRNYGFTDEEIDRANEICNTLHRFATLPHFDEEQS